MPTYRSITISLVSQFDLLTIPEYAPPTHSDDPFWVGSGKFFPQLIDSDRPLVSVYIPTYPSSQFWISYSISAPHPPKALYYFKLFLDGALVVSWGCGEDNDYKGKTMFGVFDGGRNEKGSKKLERRVLSFAGIDDKVRAKEAAFGNMMELKVYRSRGRRRVKPEVENFGNAAVGTDVVSKKQAKGGGVSLISAGFLHRENPQRYYQYALIDRLDQPFATFRYYYRSWDELEHLGMVSPSTSRPQSSIELPSLSTEQSPPQPEPTTSTEIVISSPKASAQDQTQPEEQIDSPLRIPPAIAPDLLQRLMSRPLFSPIPLTNLSFRRPSTTSPKSSGTQSETPRTLAIATKNSESIKDGTVKHPRPRAFKNKAAFGVRVADLVRPQSPGGESTTEATSAEQDGHPKEKEKGNMGMLNSVLGSAVRRKNKER